MAADIQDDIVRQHQREGEVLLSAVPLLPPAWLNAPLWHQQVEEQRYDQQPTHG